MKGIIYLLIMLAIAVLVASCSAKSGNYNPKQDSLKLYRGTNRVLVLENNTITYVVLSVNEAEYLKAGDTVWLDMVTHYINDIDHTTMKVVLQRRF